MISFGPKVVTFLSGAQKLGQSSKPNLYRLHPGSGERKYNSSGRMYAAADENRSLGSWETTVMASALAVSLSFGSPASAIAATAETQQIFENSCAGCHAGGGNIVKRDATLALSDLTKYGLDSPEALYDIIYSGNGAMPGFGEDCTPKGKCTFGKRLTDDQVRDLASLVLEQARQGWSS
jgi:cytochrome c6